jgi:hypothetical protein
MFNVTALNHRDIVGRMAHRAQCKDLLIVD